MMRKFTIEFKGWKVAATTIIFVISIISTPVKAENGNITFQASYNPDSYRDWQALQYVRRLEAEAKYFKREYLEARSEAASAIFLAVTQILSHFRQAEALLSQIRMQQEALTSFLKHGHLYLAWAYIDVINGSLSSWHPWAQSELTNVYRELLHEYFKDLQRHTNGAFIEGDWQGNTHLAVIFSLASFSEIADPASFEDATNLPLTELYGSTD